MFLIKSTNVMEFVSRDIGEVSTQAGQFVSSSANTIKDNLIVRH